MFSLKPFPALLVLGLVLVYASPAAAFGAGNIASISKIEGQNWRHGDIEDTLLTILLARAAGGKNFDKLAVSRVYFGNWLRDYSQAIDVGTVKAVSAEAIRLLLSILGFLTFSYGAREFEVTAERLGCYRPEDHIDNPKDYADNADARQYDRRLRGPIDERVELAVDQETGMKNYIANERVGIMTSAQHVRNLFGRCIELGRSYNRNRNKDDFYEALRLLGTGLHCLEDYLAHSNYLELALIEMGERDVFPHVGRDTRMRLNGARDEVYPIVTGTFGGVDFLHSVTGEVSDKLAQNEIEELEGVLQTTKYSDNSIVENLLDKIPDGILGGGKKQKMNEIQDNATASQVQNMSVSPKEPEEYTRYIQQVFRQIMPAIEFHDDVMKAINEAVDKIPVLPKLIEQLSEQMTIWVFAIIAPFILPVINQIKNELRTGSSEIIQSSEPQQHIVFNDNRSTDPTHSMLSKDHFSNILNEPAGKTASKVLSWVVPQLMQAWDDESIDIGRTMNRIINGVMHHPAQRNMGEDGARDGRNIMFQSTEEWWRQMSDRERDDLRRKLSRDGVYRGENHKEGVQDTGHGHGCGGKLGIKKSSGGGLEDKIVDAASGAILGGITGGISDVLQSQTGLKLPEYRKTGTGEGRQEQSYGGGGGGYGGGNSGGNSSGGGGGLSGFINSVGGNLLGGAFGQRDTQAFESRRDDGNSYTESRTEYGRSGDRYGQAEYSETHRRDGGESSTYRRYEQDDRNNVGYMQEERTETRPSRYGESDYESRTERYESRQETSWGDHRRDEYGGREENRYESSEERRDEGSGGDFLSGMISSVGRAMGDSFNNEGGEDRYRREDGERREW